MQTKTYSTGPNGLGIRQEDITISVAPPLSWQSRRRCLPMARIRDTPFAAVAAAPGLSQPRVIAAVSAGAQITAGKDEKQDRRPATSLSGTPL
jgi:hypothetical protein